MAAPPTSFEQKLIAAVERYEMLASGDRVLIALSGGQDSLALLHCLHALAPDLGVELAAGHLHHGMRGAEADADEECLRELCESLPVPFFSDRVCVPDLARERGISVEEAGRAARYEFLRGVAAREGFTKLALGHTATDRAETVLMNILRGSGLEGLRGIPPVNGEIIRPLILLTREETGAYCNQHGLEPRLDRTNLDTDAYLRNRLRLKLVPQIQEEYAPGVMPALLRLAEAVEQELQWTQPQVQDAFDGARSGTECGLGLKLEALQELPEGLLARVLRRGIHDLAGSLAGFTSAHVAALVGLVRDGETGNCVDLPFEIRAERGYNLLTLTASRPVAEEPDDWEIVLIPPGVVHLPVGGMLSGRFSPLPANPQAAGPCEAYLDADIVGEALVVRNWRKGERICPLGMKGSKKLQDVFVDAKVARRERVRTPVVLTSTGEILWVAGVCVSRVAALTPETARCIHLSWARARSPIDDPDTH